MKDTWKKAKFEHFNKDDEIGGGQNDFKNAVVNLTRLG